MQAYSPHDNRARRRIVLASLIWLAAGFTEARATALLQALPLKKDAGTYGLTETPELLGRYGLTASDVLQELAPHLAPCSVRLVRTETSGAQTVHEVYALYFGQYRIAGARLHLHHHQNKLVMVRAELPDFRLPQAEFTAADFLAPEDLGFFHDKNRGGDTGIRQASEAVIADSSGLPAPAWEILRHDETLGQTEKLLVDAQTGAVLAQESANFDVAKVYQRGPQDGQLIDAPLPDLPGTGYLDGKQFIVYAPGEADPRVQAPDDVFDFLPDDPADALLFDQVQAYYSATRAMAWFHERFGYDPGPTPMVVRVNALIRGRPDNAQFVPPPLGPELQIGKGNEQIHNLARDSDVVIHELSHSVLYHYVQSHEGEAGILHEGYSDYFAYALNGDPNLGESIIAGAPFMRTAALSPSVQFDATPMRATAHVGGQIWSAYLWELRAVLGDKADDLVYASFSYLGASSGLRDAVLGLLSADRDLSPLTADDPEHGVYGTHKCVILKGAVARGFAAYLAEFDGASCGFDLAKLSEDSKKVIQIANGDGPIEGKHFGLTIGGKTCAVIPSLGETSDVSLLQVVSLLTLFLLPLGCSLLQAAYAPARRKKRGD